MTYAQLRMWDIKVGVYIGLCYHLSTHIKTTRELDHREDRASLYRG